MCWSLPADALKQDGRHLDGARVVGERNVQSLGVHIQQLDAKYGDASLIYWFRKRATPVHKAPVKNARERERERERERATTYVQAQR